jgi:formate hydrogenlyase subunit 3/multisubunit Na+/H+ antiporter MnhD subunit
MTWLTSLGAVLANHLIVLLVCWGLTGVFLYLLIGYGDKARTPATAKKAFIIVGGSDAFMILGVALIGRLSGSLDIPQIQISLDQPLAVYAFLSLLIGSLAKAGAMPLHTWIPDTAEDAPTPVTAFLPASVDKLLGIYLLARMTLDLFVMNAAMYTLLMVFGAVTIIGAGLMMLIQSDFKRVLGYCAVSQVGYILLGIGTGHPIGIAGGLFHMVNHAIYKSCLFFSGGVVEKGKRSTDLERLGGLARQMPVIYITFLIAALSVSGVPPLNGFASKWMIYQGLIESAQGGGGIRILWLVVAMFGSALTLAGMMKLVFCLFLGQPATVEKGQIDQEEKTPLVVYIPPICLALICLLFGVWADALPLRYFIFPVMGQTLNFPGIWQPGLATVLILIGIGLGGIFYLCGQLARRTRQTDVFIGGETLDAVPGMRVSGKAFYNSIQELPVLRSLYRLAQEGVFDIYQIASRMISRCIQVLRYLHNGILSYYVSWCLLGVGILFYLLVIR